MDEFVFDSIKIYFEDEIFNKHEIEEKQIVVSLLDGTKAKITIKKSA